MGLFVSLLLCRRRVLIINAHYFMAEHIPGLELRGREDKNARGLKEEGVRTVAPDYRKYHIYLNFQEKFHEQDAAG